MAKRLQLDKENLPPSKSRFNFCDSEDDFEEHKLGFVPKNTLSDTQKCLNLFQEWRDERTARFPEDAVPHNILQSDKDSLCKWFSRFATEVRKKDGSPYPPRTIYHYLLGIQRHLRSQGKEINIMTDKEFLILRNVLDSVFRKLHAEGIGTSVKKTPVLEEDDEEQLWSSGVLNPETPQGLLNCVFFLNGKNFCLRGGDEHRHLKLSQLQREAVVIDGRHKVRYTYTEYVSKNRAGGLKQIKQQNKVVHQYESDNVKRCHVLLLDKYISKLPGEGKKKDLLYARPKTVLPKDYTSPWFTAVPVGRHTLSLMMQRMSPEAHLQDKFTNHSLRAYGVTKMFKASIPEKIVMERSGHRSVEGVRQYERTDTEQELQVCKVLDSKPSTAVRVSDTTQPPPMPNSTQNPSFSGCTFNNCTFQLSAPTPAILPRPPVWDDFSDVDLKELFDF